MKLKDYGAFEVELNEFCILIWLQEYRVQGVECGGLNENGSPYARECLVCICWTCLDKIRCTLVRGDVSMGVGFENSKTYPISSAIHKEPTLSPSPTPHSAS